MYFFFAVFFVEEEGGRVFVGFARWSRWGIVVWSKPQKVAGLWIVSVGDGNTSSWAFRVKEREREREKKNDCFAWRLTTFQRFSQLWPATFSFSLSRRFFLFFFNLHSSFMSFFFYLVISISLSNCAVFFFVFFTSWLTVINEHSSTGGHR